MLCVVAITAFVTITCTVKADPKEEAILNFLADLLKTKKISVELVDPYEPIRMPFRKAVNSNANVVDLVVEDGQKRNKWRSGIQIKNDRRLIRYANAISLEVYKDIESQQQMRLIIHFGAMQIGLCKLYVPVFQIPDKYLEDEELLSWWAQDKGVSCHSPFNLKELISLASGETVELHFGWLKIPLSYELYRYHKSFSNEISAWTRPLVLRPELIRELMKLWKNFKGTGNSGSS